jgi:hypothetical protein
MKKLLIIAIAALTACSTSENPQKVVGNFKKHVEYLASDELEGRETGTEGEIKAAGYIEEEFRKIGLEPKGTSGFYQEFDFLSGKAFGDNKLKIGEKEMNRDEDYFVMNFSGNGEAEGELVLAGFGIVAEELGFDDYANVDDIEGKIVLLDVSSPDGIHPHSKYKAYHDLRNRVNIAAEKGAAAVIFHNPGDLAEDPKRNYSRRMESVEIPVLFVNEMDKPETGVSISLKVEMNDDYKKGRNVIGFIDKKAAHTVVIGAHYDHLGYGGEGSLYRGGEREIHNGADDNASGTAIMIELARSLANKPELEQNFLFIAFSGEEKGLLGSAHYTDEPTIELEAVNYMINMDMVGRLDSANTLTVFGIGTSPVWDSIADAEQVAGNLNVAEKPDGVGPSDHTSFYLENIPVLHLFTGAHGDYHKPSDDTELLNYEGMYEVYSYILRLIEGIGSDKIEFTKTKDGDNQQAPRFSVTLGVVPDYTFTGKGMKIDGVTEGRPAYQAGIQKGDVVIRMGDMDVVDMMAYMTALSMFKKGDSTRVIVKRGSEEIDVQVNF